MAKRIELARRSLAQHEDELLAFIASGTDVDPRRISPRLHQVQPGTVESRLFRYACLHWSIPISDGYGRRLRFLIFDDANDKLIGLFGLGDPVYSIRARDELIGWTATNRAARLYHVMDAYVLGAVPPYSHLLGGKLVALAAATDECACAFRARYAGRRAILSERNVNRIVILTTTSALGRSSIYNRIRFRQRFVFRSAGSPVDGANFIFPMVFTICSPISRTGTAHRQRSARSGARDFAIGATRAQRRSSN